MASASEMGSKTPVAGGTVAGYFVRSEDARSAIDALMDRGFDVREIGAAFHSRVRRDPMLAVEEEPSRRMSSSDDSIAGVASGSRAVTPSGLSTGAGTGIPGLHRPGPITGAELPSDLPREIPSALPTDSEARAMRGQKESESLMPASPQDACDEDERSWRERLESVFGRERSTGRMAASRKFGTGEGHLGDIADYAYSNRAFEQSFASMGIPPEHARRLAHELQQGGAVVTVKAGARTAEAESALLQHHGVIRYEAPLARRELREDTGAARMEIFGEVHRVYPNYVPPQRQIARKAS